MKENNAPEANTLRTSALTQHQLLMLRRGLLLGSRCFRSPLIRHVSSQPSTTEKLKISLFNDQSVETDSQPTTNSRVKSTDRGGRETQNSLPPSLQYVRDIMDKYSDHIVITQIGSFYELYFEHATIYAPKLNITLTGKELASGRVPFAGFPLAQLNRHLKVLVKELGYSVAVCDQFKHEDLLSNNKTRFTRRVTRIVTPGTFIDEALENLQENHFLLTLEFPENCMKRVAAATTPVGLCWCDISTGEIFVQEVFLKDLVSSITRIRPMEILLEEDLLQFNLTAGEWYPELIELKKYFVKYQKVPSKHRPIQSFFKLFSDHGGEMPILLKSFTQKEIASLRSLLLYIEEHLPDMNTNLELPQKQLLTEIMQIDSRTSSALELHATMRENHKKGSLFSAIRRTVTSSGTRLLTQWLSAPSMNLVEIKKRQSLVQLFKENQPFSESLIRYLKQTSDMTRIIQRFSFGRGDPLELIQLAKSLELCNEVSLFLQSSVEHSSKGTEKLMKSIADELKFDHPLTTTILSCLNEDSLVKQRDSKDDDVRKEEDVDAAEEELWIMKPSASKTLKRHHSRYIALSKEKEELQKWYEEWFMEKFKLKNVALKQKNSGEFCIHLSGSVNNLSEFDNFINDQNATETTSSHFRVVQKSKQTRWVVHDKWEALSQEIEIVTLLIRKEEQVMLSKFQKDFIDLSTKIRSLSQLLDYLDVLSSLGKLANEQRLVKPKMSQKTQISIKNGRHLVVEAAISQKSLESFTPNDCMIDSGELWVITGPNMGGKSTFLRQTAIIVILAQIGSFVPCESAVIGLVDKIFSRVGSADDLYNEMSTFMVEMIETSYILKGATERSLAILDEIGRGTSRSEGIAIAYATLQYLVRTNRCRALFATHFGKELSDTINQTFNQDFIESVSFYKTGIVGDDETFFYDHKLKPGVCSKSDAIKVAKLAGFPQEAIDTASKVLADSVDVK